MITVGSRAIVTDTVERWAEGGRGEVFARSSLQNVFANFVLCAFHCCDVFLQIIQKNQ